MQIQEPRHPKKSQENYKEKNSEKIIGYKTFVIFTLIPIFALSVIGIIAIDRNLWVMHGVDHFYFEMISVILSFIVAYYCIMRGYAFRDKFSLFIGLGFHVGGMIDLLHGSFAILNLGESAFEGYFIPQTWVAGRIVMGAVLMIACVKYGDLSKIKEKISSRKYVIVYTTLLAAIAGAVTSWSLYEPFPFITIDFLIQRPYELISAGFFLVAIIFFYKNRLHLNHDHFFKGILVVLVIDIFVSLIISYSTFVFDAPFTIAHLLKNVSFFIFIMALASSTVQQYKIKNKAENSLRELSDNLSQQVKERTKDLNKANEQLKRNYEDLKKIDEDKEQFTSMISHELKTPITPIMIWTDALLENDMFGKLNEEQSDAVKKIQISAESLKKLVNDVFDAHKLNLSKLKFTLNDTTVQKILDLVLENAIKSGKPNGIKVINSTKQDFALKTDENRIAQVLNNLINNSLDFVPHETGTIEINASKLNNEIQFFVKDNGIGIRKSSLKNIFKKYYQIDTTLTREHGGSGLGLSICEGIVEGLSGKMWVDSEIGKGTTVYFKIPLTTS